MNGFPYYRWYPADAKADEKYSSMNDTELGFYHRCLDHSWENQGIPSDPGELARLMHVTRAYLQRIWLVVGKCWTIEHNGRLFNPRQERERSKALQISDSKRRIGNANASKEKREKSASETQMRNSRVLRAYDSGSVSGSDFAFKENPSLRKIEQSSDWPSDWDFEEWFQQRMSKHPLPGKPQIARGYALEKVWAAFAPFAFDASHSAWCQYWETQSGGIPSLATFIFEDWWKRKPPDPPKSKSMQRAEAFAREMEAERKQEELNANKRIFGL